MMIKVAKQHLCSLLMFVYGANAHQLRFGDLSTVVARLYYTPTGASRVFLPRNVIIPSSWDIDGFPPLFCAPQEMLQNG
jgi:hypothetical protein